MAQRPKVSPAPATPDSKASGRSSAYQPSHSPLILHRIRLPVGIQLVGHRFADWALLGHAKWIFEILTAGMSTRIS
jgi:Asp-tRNA(Asn)/Glu-tRNA(Gln) amidotransferase A subunit family amidase